MSADQLDLELPASGPAAAPPLAGHLFLDGGDMHSASAQLGEDVAPATTVAPKLTPPSRITDVPRPSPGREPTASGDAGIVTLAVEAPLVIGLDLSLTRTGIAGADWTTTIATEPRDGGGMDDELRRINLIRTGVLDLVRVRGAELVVVESPAFNQMKGAGQHKLAGLWWSVVGGLREWGYPVATATAGGLKKYATGSGRGDKDPVIRAATRRFAWFEGCNDEADALWLAAMGFDHLGHPLVQMPAINREALVAVKWPGGH
jgi:Holliday junction resolvasome RuvABC endonuclease subunit